MTNNHEPGELGRQGLSVVVKNNNIDKAIKIFKKKVLTDGLLKELKAREAYEKPSVKKRRKKAEAVRRERKEQAQRKQQFGF